MIYTTRFSTATNIDVGGGSDWTNPTYALTSNDQRSTCIFTYGGSGDKLALTDTVEKYPFTSAKITKIEALIEGFSGPGGTRQLTVYLVVDGAEVANKVIVMELTESVVIATFTTADFGTSLLIPDINASNFGIRLQVSTIDYMIYVDLGQVRVTVEPRLAFFV